MCENTYVNIQTGEVLDMEKVSTLIDNAMLKHRPDLWTIWDLEKNNELGLDIYKVTKSSDKKCWWYCGKCEESYPQIINKKVIYNRGCSICCGRYVTDKNSFGALFPELVCEWNFNKNNVSPFEISHVNSNKFWWTCGKCDHDYEMTVVKKIKGVRCIYCIGRKVSTATSLAKINPKLAKEWHPTKNGELTPNDVTGGQAIMIWWKCELGHEWKSIINNRSKGKGCPYCSNRKVNRDNCMWTTNPELASMLVDPEDGYKYTQFSNKKVNWRCPDCSTLLKNKIINNVNKKGVCCSNCSDGISYPEKFIRSLLQQLNVKFQYNSTTAWSNNKRYDILFEYKGKKVIIEMNGEQHYKECGWRDGKSLKDEMINDSIKKKLALTNGVEYYIEINCMRSNFNYIKNNIINSELDNVIELKKVDWKKCHLDSCSSVVKKACNYWNTGNYSINEIAVMLNVSYSTVHSYLKKGSIIRLCDYVTKNNR